MSDMTAFERQVEQRIQRFVGPVRPVDDLAVFDAVVATPRPHRQGSTMFAVLKLAAAGAIVALFGGFLLAGILVPPQREELAPAAVTEGSSPTMVESLLSGLTTEEVEPGVFRVDHDGMRDLSPAAHEYVVVGQDGSIWLGSDAGDLAKVGATTTFDWRLRPDEYLMDFEVAPDGTVWAVTFSEESSELRSFDGEAWTMHAAVDPSRFVGNVEIAPDGVVWAVLSDGVLGYLDTGGPTWQTIEMPVAPPPFGVRDDGFVATESGIWAWDRTGIWHYADGVWGRITYGVPDAGAMHDEVFWGMGPGPTGDGETLYRHDGSGWQRWSLTEDHMLASWSASPQAMAPDGSFWAAWPGRGGLGTPDVLGVNRFDGRAWERFLPSMSVWPFGMDVAADGSVWLIGWDASSADVDKGPGADAHLYVITPEAVAASQ